MAIKICATCDRIASEPYSQTKTVNVTICLRCQEELDNGGRYSKGNGIEQTSLDSIPMEGGTTQNRCRSYDRMLYQTAIEWCAQPDVPQTRTLNGLTLAFVFGFAVSVGLTVAGIYCLVTLVA